MFEVTILLKKSDIWRAQTCADSTSKATPGPLKWPEAAVEAEQLPRTWWPMFFSDVATEDKGQNAAGKALNPRR